MDHTAKKENINTVEDEYEEYKANGNIWGLVPKERIKKIKFPRVNKKIIDELLTIKDLSTTISDVLDSLGIVGAIPASYLSPILPGKKIVGTAVTMRNIPERKTPTQGYIDKDFIRMSTREVYCLAEEGDILVTDSNGNLDISNMGGQSCTAAKTMGLAGCIVNGAVRDVPTIKDLDYPVWSCGRTPLTGKFRLETVEINGPVSIRNVVVHPGDLVVADDSGICFIPQEKAEYVLEKAKAIESDEEEMRQLIVKKAPIDEIKAVFRKRY